MGKLSDGWLILQPHFNNNHGNKRSNCIWGVSLVEASLKSYIELWEQRNKDAHSPEAHLHLQPGNYTNFASMHNFAILRYFLTTLNNLWKYPQHRNFNSKFSWIAKPPDKACAMQGMSLLNAQKFIINWFRPVQEQSSATLQQHPRDNLVHDAYSKEKQHRPESALTDRTCRPRLMGYLPLREEALQIH